MFLFQQSSICATADGVLKSRRGTLGLLTSEGHQSLVVEVFTEVLSSEDEQQIVPLNTCVRVCVGQDVAFVGPTTGLATSQKSKEQCRISVVHQQFGEDLPIGEQLIVILLLRLDLPYEPKPKLVLNFDSGRCGI